MGAALGLLLIVLVVAKLAECRQSAADAEQRRPSDSDDKKVRRWFNDPHLSLTVDSQLNEDGRAIKISDIQTDITCINHIYLLNITREFSHEG